MKYSESRPLAYVLLLLSIPISQSFNYQIHNAVHKRNSGCRNSIVCRGSQSDLDSSDEPSADNAIGRRKAMQGMAGLMASNLVIPSLPVSASPTNFAVPSPADSASMSWPLGKVAFSLLPLAGTSTRRATVETTIIKDTMWTHDQVQGVA